MADWLAWIETLHPRTIELGLERVHTVLDALDLRRPSFAVITISGTNGKGSTAAFCASILRCAGYRVGLYTSPHLIRYNERVRVNGLAVSDADLCAAFERIETARASVPLTYFEFGTVAAFHLFEAARIDIAVLEVGMGGRLDAVNAIDPDVAVLTSIDIDHTAWLGNTREQIGREKAGIFRGGRPAVCGDADPPTIIAAEAARVGARLLQIGRDFQFERRGMDWSWRWGDRLRTGLPHPSLRGDFQLSNAACALTALETLADRFPLSQGQVREGLIAGVIPGRFQVLPGRPLRVLDVAHNPQAARALATTLHQQKIPGRTLAVFGMLQDKDIAAVVRALSSSVDRWYPATLKVARGATSMQLIEVLAAAGVSAPTAGFEDVPQAYAAACRDAGEGDRVLVFGSFHTVGDILAQLETV